MMKQNPHLTARSQECCTIPLCSVICTKISMEEPLEENHTSVLIIKSNIKGINLNINRNLGKTLWKDVLGQNQQMYIWKKRSSIL